MAQKKCPKCGEDNPAEAVMCWACYTPLTGAVAAGAGAGAAGVATRAAASPARPAQAEDGDKKPISPGLIGLLGVVVLIGIAIGLKSVFGNSNTTWEGVNPLPQPKNPSPPLDIGQPPTGQVAPPPQQGGGTGVPLPGQIPPVATPYKITALPNAGSPYGTMAIVPTEPNVSESRAASLAAFQLRRYSKAQMSRWNRFFIFVFKDTQTAQTFNTYIQSRRGAPLSNTDYANLRDIWPSTLVRYEYYNRHEYVDFPSKEGAGWWLKKNRT